MKLSALWLSHHRNLERQLAKDLQEMLHVPEFSFGQKAVIRHLPAQVNGPPVSISWLKEQLKLKRGAKVDEQQTDYSVIRRTEYEEVKALLEKQSEQIRDYEAALEQYASLDSWVRTSFCHESHWDKQISKEPEHPMSLARETLAKWKK